MIAFYISLKAIINVNLSNNQAMIVQKLQSEKEIYPFYLYTKNNILITVHPKSILRYYNKKNKFVF
ncbi:uncharacterized protein Dvar_43530 [Desulfosarcina variabilis str. Montpellier]